MRILHGCLGIVIVAGCTGHSPENSPSVESSEKRSSVGTSEDGVPVVTPGDSTTDDTHSTRDGNTTYYTYTCESGQTVVAWYPDVNTAQVKYDGQTYEMDVVISASGARYAGDGLEWWTKGTGPGADGTLYYHHDGETGDVIESCHQK